MSSNVAFWIFVIGAVSWAILFVGITWNSHRQVEALSHVDDKLSDKAVAGEKAFEKNDSNDCRTIMVFYYAMPKIKGVEVCDDSRGKFAFWTMSTAMMLMGLSSGIAGVVQSYLERVLGMGYMAAQSHMRIWMGVTVFLGICFFIGVLVLVTDLLTIRPAKKATA